MKKYLFLLSFIFAATGAYPQGIITTIAGIGIQSDTGVGGPAIDAGLDGPYAVALDGLGNYYIADGYSNRICKVDASGIFTVIAGTGFPGYNGDSIPAVSAELNRPVGIICDHSGNVYFADAHNNRIRKINVSTGIITTIAGNGVAGYNGDNITADTAELSDPHCIAFDTAGNLYITDWDNYRIRKVNTSGIITTIAGTGVPSGHTAYDGLADTTEVNEPYGIITDVSGNVYFADSYTSVVRKISVSGMITTFAGTSTFGPGIGDNGPADSARLAGPGDLAMDNLGNIYIGDAGHQRIRKINTATNIITTVAGDGSNGYNGDNIVATTAELSYPGGMAIDGAGNMYFADFGNNRIRYITSTEQVKVQNIVTENFSLYPNPNDGTFIVRISTPGQDNVKILITNMLGEAVKEIATTTNTPETVQLNNSPGAYFFTASSVDHTWNGKIIVNK